MINKKVVVIIPSYNEENAIKNVLNDIPKKYIQEIVVVNNNSNDKTALIAEENGATVLHEHRQGYGWACLKGIEYFKNKSELPEIVVFLDADYSDYPQELPDIIKPIVEDDFDLVIGSRALGKKEKGSMTPQQIFGNWLATFLIRLFYRMKFTDLGPFRAIKFDKLIGLNMKDKTYGWTVEMQIKAAKNHLKCFEVPVCYRRRIGFSKVSGTVKGTISAGYRIILTIIKYI